MTEGLGIGVLVTPDLTGFTAELEKQLQASLRSIGPKAFAGLDAAAADAGAEIGDSLSAAALKTTSFTGLQDKAAAAGVSAGRAAGAGLAKGVSAETKAGGGALTSLFGNVKSIVPSLAIFSGATEALKGVKGAIADAANAQKVGERSQLIFGAGYAGIEKAAKGAASQVGLSNVQFQTSAAAFGLLGSKAGLTGSQLSSFATTLTGRARDLSTAFGVQFPAALSALQSGLVGNTRGLRQFGILLSTTDVKNEALRLGIVKAVVNQNALTIAREKAVKAEATYQAAVTKSGKNSVAAISAAAALGTAQDAVTKAAAGTVPALTKQQTVLATNSLVLQRTNKFSGDFAKSSGDLANRQAVLSAKLANLAETLGQDLEPVIILAAGGFLTLVNGIGATVSFIDAHKAEFIALGVAILALNANTILYKATLIALQVQEKAAAIAGKLLALAQGDLDVAMDANPIGLVVIALAALVLAFVEAYKHSQTFRDIVHAALHDVTLAFHDVIDAASAVIGFVSDHWKLIASLLGGPIVAVTILISTHIDQIVGFFTKLPGRIEAIGGAMLSAGESIIGKLISGLGRAGGAIGNTAKDIIDAVISGINNDAINPLKDFHFTLGFAGVHHTFQPFGSIPDIPLLASGAVISRPTVVGVGEAGPEVVIPLSPARRAQANQLLVQSGLLSSLLSAAPARGGDGASSNTINVYPVTDDPQAIAAQVVNRMAAAGGVR